MSFVPSVVEGRCTDSSHAPLDFARDERLSFLRVTCNAASMHPLISHRPDPDRPGWWTWDVLGEERYNATLGKLLVQADGPGRARCRMFPETLQSNLGNLVHGGAILTFIDMALFAGGHVAGVDIAYGVTLDLSAQFLGPARLGQPLDTNVELLRETRRLAFMRGLVEQEGALVASWSGTIRKGGEQS